jgi:ribonuclease J
MEDSATQVNNMTENETSIKIIPLGGLGGIGKNITLIEYKDEIIIIDCGIMFPNDELPGIDFIIPDFSYIRENSNRVKGIIITHGHEDHIGALPFLLQEITVPVYATRLTIGLIQSRLDGRPPKEQPEFHEIAARGCFNVGCFNIEFIRVNHSIIDGVGLAIKTDIGTIIHSGDFKIDFSPVDGMVTDISRFAYHGEEGVLLLMSDSTNAEKPGYTKSESLLEDKLSDIFSTSKGRIIVATFASNIHRIQQVLDVAQRYNRNVVISGLTMLKNIEIATTLGYLNYREGLIVDIKDANSLPHKKLVVIGTGSQGEPMSALHRMANGTHRHFLADRGDTVIITASVIPGNEKTVRNIVNSLMKLGAKVYYEQDEGIHVSGHAAAEELKLMLTMVKPKHFMPIHGEYRHLKTHAEIAESLDIKSSRIIIADNGDILELNQRSFKKTGSIPLTQIYVDGSDVGDVESTVIKDRQTMSVDGILIATVIISERMLMRRPEIVSRGFIGIKNIDLIELITLDIEEQANRLLMESYNSKELAAHLKKGLKNTVYKLTRRYPIIEVQVLEV